MNILSVYNANLPWMNCSAKLHEIGRKRGDFAMLTTDFVIVFDYD